MKKQKSFDRVCDLSPELTEKCALSEEEMVVYAQQEPIVSLPALVEVVESHNPVEILQNVETVVQSWGQVVPMAPYDFLVKLLTSRGYDGSFIPHPTKKRSVPQQQISDYDNEIIAAVRTSDIALLQDLHGKGKSMMACNKYHESIVHMACRISSREAIEFIISHGGDVNQLDDLGRNPMHDACWRENPMFDVVSLILDINKDLLRMCDSRGATPLHYTRQVHWLHWCAYLQYVSDRYWPPVVKNQP